MNDDRLLDDDERREYVKSVGKGGIQLLVVIDKLKPIVDLWLHNELGKQLLDDAIREHVKLMNKVFDSIIEKGEADRQDLIALKYTYGHLKKIGNSISNYDNLIAKGKKSVPSQVAGTQKRTRHGTKKV
jgi:hypothetical protein